MKSVQSTAPDFSDDAGLRAVTGASLCDSLERRGPWLVLAFGLACVVWSAYMRSVQAWILGVVPAVWSVVAIRRWFLDATLNLENHKVSLS